MWQVKQIYCIHFKSKSWRSNILLQCFMWLSLFSKELFFLNIFLKNNVARRRKKINFWFTIIAYQINKICEPVECQRIFPFYQVIWPIFVENMFLHYMMLCNYIIMKNNNMIILIQFYGFWRYTFKTEMFSQKERNGWAERKQID